MPIEKINDALDLMHKGEFDPHGRHVLKFIFKHR